MRRGIGTNCARKGPPGCPKLVAVLDLPLRAYALGGGPKTTQQKESLRLVVFGAGQLCLAGTQAIRWVSKHSRLRVCLVVFSSCLVVFSLCLLVFGVCLVVCSGTWACDCVAKSVFSVFVCVQTQHCSTLNCVCLCLELCLAVFETVFGSAQISV